MQDYLKEGFLTNKEWSMRVKPFLDGSGKRFLLVFLKEHNFIYNTENHQVFLCKIKPNGVFLKKIDSPQLKEDHGISLKEIVKELPRKNLSRK
jgi:hypothetical protein